MQTLVASLLVWIAAQIGGDVPPPPHIRIVPALEMVERAYGTTAPDDVHIAALYRREDRTIFLPVHWRIGSLRDRAALLHELVHHTQEVTGLAYPCVAAREPLAYELQAEWLRSNGVVDPYAFIGINEFTIRVLSICPAEE